MMKRVAIIALVVVPMYVYGQQKPIYEKKMHVSTDGKLYVNKNLPVYLWLSTSPDEGSQKIKLKSEVTTRYSNPMYFDADGYNTFRSPSAVDTVTKKMALPQQDVVFEVYADASAPSTSTDFGENPPFVSGGKSFLKSNTQVTLISKDKLSGVESVYYSMDGSAYAKYTQPLTFTEEREYILKYYAVDNVGNDEKVEEVTLIYDNTSPVTTRTISVDEYTNIISARSKIELKAEDKGIGLKKIVFKLDEGAETTYQYPINASLLSQGEHTLVYYSVDKVNNKETAQNYSFYIDKSSPTIIEEIIAKTFFANGKEYASGKAQLKLTAFDNKSGIREIRYSINGGEYQRYEKPVFLSESSGNLVIQTYAVDNVNNKSESQAANQGTSVPYIDLAGPGLHYSFTGPIFNSRDTIFISNKTRILLRGSDQEAGISRIEYRIDGLDNLDYSAPFTLTGEGVHTISYTGYDNVENSSSSSFIVKVDTTGPEIGYTFSTVTLGKTGSKDVYPKHLILFLSGTDEVVGVENVKYSFNQEPAKVYAMPITGFSSGEKKIKLIATDKLGNTTEKIIEFNIKD